MKKALGFLIIALVLSSCNGSSGGGSTDTGTTSSGGGGVSGCTDSLATNYDALATTDDGSCTGRNGNATYYSLSTGSTQQNDIAAPVGSQEISGNIFIKASSGLEVGVYNPTCTSITEDYSMILVSQGNTSAETTFALEVISTGAYTVGNKFTSPNTAVTAASWNGSLTTRMSNGAKTLVTGNCYLGKRTLSNGAILFSNGNVAVYKETGTSGALYIGVKSLSALNTKSTVMASPTGTSTNMFVYVGSVGTILSQILMEVSGQTANNSTIYTFYSTGSHAPYAIHAVTDNSSGTIPVKYIDLGNQTRGSMKALNIQLTDSSSNPQDLFISANTATATNLDGTYFTYQGTDQVTISISND